MVGEDSETLGQLDIAGLAEQIVDAQAQLVANAIERNWMLLVHNYQRSGSDARARCEPINMVSSGHGRPLFDRALAQLRARWKGTAQPRVCMLTDLLPDAASRCAPAAATAWLASYC